MNIQKFDGPKALLSIAKDYLHKKEAENGLIIGLLMTDNYPSKEDDLYLAVMDSDVSFVCIKRGKGLIFAGEDSGFEQKVDLLLSYLGTHDLTYPSILGPRKIVDYFRDKLQEVGQATSLMMSQRIYQINRVKRIELSEGILRSAKTDEIHLLVKWFEGFFDEIEDESVTEDYALKRTTDFVNEGRLYVWEVKGLPVSMVAKVRETDNGATVSMVYTPIEHRGKGYASSAVWTLSAEILKSYKFAMLYTDLANRTSNKIYRAIGYVPVVDSAIYTLED